MWEFWLQNRVKDQEVLSNSKHTSELNCGNGQVVAPSTAIATSQSVVRGTRLETASSRGSCISAPVNHIEKLAESNPSVLVSCSNEEIKNGEAASSAHLVGELIKDHTSDWPEEATDKQHGTIEKRNSLSASLKADQHAWIAGNYGINSADREEENKIMSTSIQKAVSGITTHVLGGSDILSEKHIYQLERVR